MRTRFDRFADWLWWDLRPLWLPLLVVLWVGLLLGARWSEDAGKQAGTVHRDPAGPGWDSPDPFVLADGDGWVLYSTQVGLRNVPVSTSLDLRSWAPPVDALPQLPAWAAWGHTWAPGVLPRGAGYVLYFAARHAASGRQCVGLATALEPAGPFVPVGTAPLVCQLDLGGSIDPHPFVDADGTAYLLWKADGNAVGRASTLYAQRLAPDGLALAGAPVELLTSGAPWEDPLVENPALVATAGAYALLYSGGWWESDGYATGYATCATPLGPCERVTTGAPLVPGAGGATVVAGPDGRAWLAYHGWAGAVGYAAGGVRELRFAPWEGLTD